MYLDTDFFNHCCGALEIGGFGWETAVSDRTLKTNYKDYLVAHCKAEQFKPLSFDDWLDEEWENHTDWGPSSKAVTAKLKEIVSENGVAVYIITLTDIQKKRIGEAVEKAGFKNVARGKNASTGRMINLYVRGSMNQRRRSKDYQAHW